ncbi:MAG TPA: endonuclease domain-containing protein [Pseudolabrys sp.]|nr:endonuclease domain-containing protein [Pseudolabrys sp.]
MRTPQNTISRARQFRRALSMPEARLWTILRTREPGRPVFRRQHPIGPYIVDFYCAKARLAVEIDGLAHDMGSRPQRDLYRDGWLASQDVTVVHIAAGQLISRSDINEAADAILRMAADRLQRPLHHASHGPPPPLRGGG